MFTRLGAFAGPAELEELEAVAGDDGLDVLEAIAGLTEVSLVTRVETGDARVRFGLPEALRRIAAERLAASADADRWHLAHARRQLTRSWGGRLMHTDTIAEHRMAAEAEPEAMLAIDRVATIAPDVAAGLRAMVGTRLVNVGRVGVAVPLLEAAAVAEPDDPVVRATVLLGLGTIAAMNSDAPTAISLLDEARAVLGDRDDAMTAGVLGMRGLCRSTTGDPAGGIADSVAGREVAPRESAAEAGALSLEAQAYAVAGDSDTAAQRLETAIVIARATDATALWHCDSIAGDIAFSQGRFVDAAHSYERSLQLADERQDDQQIAFDLIATAGTLAVLGDDRGATIVRGILDAHCAMLGADLDSPLPLSTGRSEAAAAEHRLRADGAALRRTGAGVPPGQRIARARALAADAARTLAESADSRHAGTSQASSHLGTPG